MQFVDATVFSQTDLHIGLIRGTFLFLQHFSHTRQIQLLCGWRWWCECRHLDVFWGQIHSKWHSWLIDFRWLIFIWLTIESHTLSEKGRWDCFSECHYFDFIFHAYCAEVSKHQLRLKIQIKLFNSSVPDFSNIINFLLRLYFLKILSNDFPKRFIYLFGLYRTKANNLIEIAIFTNRKEVPQFYHIKLSA